jgi:hypothetical protein
VLLRENQWRLDSLALQLLEKETMDEPEIYEAAGIDHSQHADEASEAGRAETK